MFALEIDFQDGVSQPEILLVRRPHAIIGSSDYAHVLIEGTAATVYELRLTRGIGSEFRCQPISKSESAPGMPPFLDGVYSGDTEISLGDITTHVTSIDADLAFQSGESPDLAGVRILRRALTEPLPVFPALAVLGSNPIYLSFSRDDDVVIGRSRKCALRLDSSDVSSEHARVGFTGDGYWVEDLGSTNGTFINGQRISGRQACTSADTLVIGAEYSIVLVESHDDLARLHDRAPSEQLSSNQAAAASHPCVISTSERVRPDRVVLTVGETCTVGRDPSNTIWIGEAHISRLHVEILLDDDGTMSVIDQSSNGTFLSGERLPRGLATPLIGSLHVIDLGGDINLAVCLNEEDERAYEERDAVGRGRQPTPRNTDVDALRQELVEPRAREDETTMVQPSPAQLGHFTSSDLNEDEALSASESLGVFEKLAQRAGNRALYDSNDEPIEPESGSENTGYEELSRPEFVPMHEQVSGDAPSESMPVMGRLNRLILGISVVVLIIVVLMAFVWFVGPDLFNNF